MSVLDVMSPYELAQECERVETLLRVAGVLEWAITQHPRDMATHLTVVFEPTALREAYLHGWADVVRRARVRWAVATPQGEKEKE